MRPVGLLSCLSIPPALLYVAGGVALTRPDAGHGGMALIVIGSTLAVIATAVISTSTVCERLGRVEGTLSTHSTDHHHIAALTVEEVELLRRMSRHVPRQGSRLN